MIIGSPYQRLIAMNGKPLTPAAFAKEQQKMNNLRAERDHQAYRLAHPRAHLHNVAARKRRRREGGAGLLRHGSSRITLDVYAQAVTPAKRKAQGKVAAMLRDGEKQTV